MAGTGSTGARCRGRTARGTATWLSCFGSHVQRRAEAVDVLEDDVGDSLALGVGLDGILVPLSRLVEPHFEAPDSLLVPQRGAEDVQRHDPVAGRVDRPIHASHAQGRQLGLDDEPVVEPVADGERLGQLGILSHGYSGTLRRSHATLNSYRTLCWADRL